MKKIDLTTNEQKKYEVNQVERFCPPSHTNVRAFRQRRFNITSQFVAWLCV